MLGENFFYEDSGKGDSERILLFTTETNIKILNTNKDWYADGTFDISPTLFKQLYSVHVIINNFDLPMLYAFLPNKKQQVYLKMFKMIRKIVDTKPTSINMDFEKAVMNAAISVYPNCLIYGCYFHLSQNFFKQLNTRSATY